MNTLTGKKLTAREAKGMKQFERIHRSISLHTQEIDRNLIWKVLADPLMEGKKISQASLARHLNAFGTAGKHEPQNRETVMRTVRKIIRDLRLNYGAPILSDSNGYWVTRDALEATECVLRMERTAKSQAKSWFRTYRALAKTFKIENKFFDDQARLFDLDSL